MESETHAFHVTYGVPAGSNANMKFELSASNVEDLLSALDKIRDWRYGAHRREGEEVLPDGSRITR